jgi:hypothetical protein
VSARARGAAVVTAVVTAATLAACGLSQGAVAAHAQGAASDPFTPAVAEAERAARRGDHARAREGAERVLAALGRRDSASVPGALAARLAEGRAWLLLAAANPPAVRQALAAFDAAAAVDSGAPEPQLRLGALWLAAYNAPEAEAAYRRALSRTTGAGGAASQAGARAEALLGLARVAATLAPGNPEALVREALQADPAHPGALALLAELQLGAEAVDSARVTAARAVAAAAGRDDADALAAWSMQGAVAWLAGDSATLRAARAGAARLQPTLAALHTALAETAGRHRRYAEGAALAALAVAADSQDVPALGVLGTTQLRVGAMDEGRRTLARAFALDPYNVTQKNMLDLLDELARYRTIDRGRFRLVAPAEEAELLAGVLLPVLEQAYDALAGRYGHVPSGPVRLELFRRSADFSVRSVGQVGLGALGVSFGPVLAMDAPSARTRGTYNWGSTALHELAHTFTLGASGHRVPRWLSEGLSVLEEWRAGRGWGADPGVGFLVRLARGTLPPVSQLSEGFVRPRSGEALGHSYLQAALVCRWIEARFGARALPALLAAYRDGADTPGAFARVLRLAPAQVDSGFAAWAAGSLADGVAAVRGAGAHDSSGGAFVAALRDGLRLVATDPVRARARLEAARALYPGYAGGDGPAWPLARMALAAGDTAEALARLAEVTARDEVAWEANRLEAAVREARGDRAGALAALERAQWLWPYDATLHARRGALAEALGRPAEAVAAWRAAVAARPADLPAMRTGLARALAAQGDGAAARRELLGVLEEAPGYEPAQALLLALRRPPGGEGRR